MLNSKTNFCFLLCLLSLTGYSCSEKKYLFNFDRDVNSVFLSKLPEISAENLVPRLQFNQIDSVYVYKTSFREAYIEQDNLVELAVLSENREDEIVPYDAGGRSTFDCYILLFKTLPHKRQTFVMFTVNYSENDKGYIKGFSPFYYGNLTNYYNLSYLHVTRVLKAVENTDNQYVLEKKALSSIMFLLDRVERDDQLRTSMRISKIVINDINTISGGKRLVLPVDSIFQDKSSLKFKLDKKLKL